MRNIFLVTPVEQTSSLAQEKSNRVRLFKGVTWPAQQNTPFARSNFGGFLRARLRECLSVLAMAAQHLSNLHCLVSRQIPLDDHT
jgi:hypothetical protein